MDFPSGTRRLQSGHVYNETVNFMEDNLLFLGLSSPAPPLCVVVSSCTPYTNLSAVSAAWQETRAQGGGGRTTKSENDEQTTRGEAGGDWWVIGGGGGGGGGDGGGSNGREGRDAQGDGGGRAGRTSRINRIWLLLSGGWWHVRAFVCNGSETVPLNKVYH